VTLQTWRIAFKVINSLTLLLPQWHALLEREVPTPLHGRVLPWYVSTQWNSTYNHLVAVFELREYIDWFTGI